MRGNRPIAVGLVLLVVCAGWLAAGHLGSPVVINSAGNYLNVNQQVVPPGESISVYAYSQAQSSTIQLLRLDPIGFSANQTQAIENGELVGEQSLPTRSGATLTFDDLEAGLYAAAMLSGGNIVAWDPVQVTTIALVQRGGATTDLVWTIELATGIPVSNVSLYREGKKVATSDQDGIAWVPDTGGSAVVATHPNGIATLGDQPWNQPTAQRVAIYTDRPLYRPGQVVHIKMIAWLNAGDSYEPQNNSTIDYHVSTYHNGREAAIERLSLETNELGSVAHELKLAADAPLGYYTVHARWNGQDFRGSFQVEEYRLPKFKVDITPNTKRIAVGDAHEMILSARYYYGEPLTEAKVHYEITGSGWGWLPCDWCSYEYAGGGESYHHEGDVSLETDGTTRLRWTPDRPGHFRIAAQVTAPTGERIDATASVTVAPADRLLQLSLSDWVIKPNETNTLQIRVTDLQERPLDQAVEISLLQGGWRYGNDGQLVEDRSILQTWSVQTNDGRAQLPFDVSDVGSYRFEVRARDELGRTTSSTLWFWASGEDWGWWRGQQLELIPERTQYEVGETIRVNVAAANDKPALVTLEGEDVYDAKVLYAGQRTASFAALARHTPNVYASVIQVDADAAYSGRSYPALRSDNVNIRVGPHAHALKVVVETDREAYSDGEKARILVRVTGPDGLPVRAEVSLAMVDEALLSLRQDGFGGLLNAFYPERRPIYPRASWQYQYWPTIEFARGASGGVTGTTGTTGVSVGDAAEQPPSSINVREYFPETALWLPQLRTDENGTLRLHALLPDSLTTWRLSVRAISANGMVGDNETSIITRRNVVADVFAPRFLVDGDEATVQATVANYIGTMTDFQTLLNVSGAEIVGADGRTLTLSHGQSDIVSYKVRASQPGTAQVTFYAWNGAEQGDAIRIRIPILPHGIESREARAGRGSQTVDIVIPPSAAQSPSKINVTLSPTIADVLVEALPYLTGFPYGCVEQTLSRFLPSLAVAQAAQDMGLNKSAIEPQLDAQVQAGIQRLYGFQHSDGSWGWWTADANNPYTTTYVVYGLALARDAGYPVNDTVLARGVAALRSMLAQERSAAPALHAYALYALSVADPSADAEVPAGTSAADLALAALIAQRSGRSDLAKEKTAKLVQLATEEGGRVHWGESQGRWGTYGIASDTMLTALALRALVETGSHDAHMHGAARWLLENRIGVHWYTTKDTAEAVLSLSAYFQREARSDEPFQVTITIDGSASAYAMDPRQLFNGSRSLERTVAPGTHTVRIQTDSDHLYWSVAGTYWDGEEPVRSKASEFRIERSMRGDDGKPVTRMRVGDEAIVRVEVTAVGEARRYVQIESPLPAGLEPLAQAAYDRPWWYGDVSHGVGTSGVSCFWCYAWSAAEVHDDRIGFFASQMDVGVSYTFEYRVRAVFPGDYHVMPPSAQEMYDPDIRGHGQEERLVVEAPAGVQFGRLLQEADELRANLYPVGATGRQITAYVVQGQDEVSRAAFDRGTSDHWTIRLKAPLVGDYWLHVDSEDSSFKKLVRRTPEAQVFPPLFNTSQEELWNAGPVLEVQSVLAESRSVPAYASIFGPREPDAFDEDSRQRRGIEGFTLLPLLVAVSILAFAFRRRRTD